MAASVTPSNDDDIVAVADTSETATARGQL